MQQAPGNIFIYAPDYTTIMVVDVLFPGWAPFKNLAVSQDIPHWVKAQRIAMHYPWQTLVGGHLGRLGTRADGELQIQYMNDLDASTRAAITSVDPTPFFTKYGAQGNAWGHLQDLPRRRRPDRGGPGDREVHRSPRRRCLHRGSSWNPCASTPGSSALSASGPDGLTDGYHDVAEAERGVARCWLTGAWLRRRRRILEARTPLRTPQELHIARLSNREIAQQPYLSHRTVSTHLYGAFRKLGITSRAQLRDHLP
ncbi:LuxR C-terminal-related transcriptional regulator [Nonomuraea sediminis]|uniref:LuxR C-terminal-related transcriptional regulator n=1 Tax=Nonomuraea sediminis TaxID=2835864 RepID=UPI001BDD92A1|nr:LuxR C-terminal-related transcriptional regulator [Nonomuraea sediminis]